MKLSATRLILAMLRPAVSDALKISALWLGAMLASGSVGYWLFNYTGRCKILEVCAMAERR